MITPIALACCLLTQGPDPTRAASEVAAPPAWSVTPAPLSAHAEALARHRHTVPGPRVLPDPARLAKARHKTVVRAVYGYYPFWLQDLASLRWEALTHIAWFSIELDAQGLVTATHGWPDTEAVQTAHAAGVRVDLAFTLFSGSGVLALCSDPGLRQTAITNMIDLMEAGDADGISVDFEGLVADTRDHFTAFITELRAGLDARGHTTAELSIAGPAVDWNQNFDLPALLDQIDWFFIMGYDYFWSGSAYAGPTGILRVTEDWDHATGWSAIRSIARYTSLVPAGRRRQILYGVPYYGREWTTASGDKGAAALSNVGSVTYSQAQAALAAGRVRQWDEGTRTPWYAWQDAGTWHQVYYDDAESLGHKYALAWNQDLGGVGMWALNHDTGHTALWDLLETWFGAAPAHPLGHRENPIPITAFPFHDERDTAEGPSQYFNYYSCNPSLAEYGREWVYQLDLCQPGVLTATVPAYPGDDPDPDLHLLGGPTEDACLARAHTDLGATLSPGRYLLTVDTYVEIPLELEGPYALDVTFAPEAGSEPCASHLTCQAGQCLCTDGALTDCGSACVDTTSDPLHCGGCGLRCPDDAACVASECQPAPPGPDASTPPDAADATDLPCCPCPDEGCGCAAGGPGARGDGPSRDRVPLVPLLVLVCLMALLGPRLRSARAQAARSEGPATRPLSPRQRAPATGSAPWCGPPRPGRSA